MSKSFGLAAVLALAGAFVGVFSGMPLLYGAVGFTLGVALSSRQQITHLVNEVARLREQLGAQEVERAAPQRPVTEQPAAQSAPEPAPTPSSATATPAAEFSVPDPEATSTPSTPERPAPEPEQVSAQQSTRAEEGVEYLPPQPGWDGRLQKFIGGAVKDVWHWFTGGNLFMRVGIVLLFLGVGFLLNYASGLGIITLEMRLIAIALAGIGGLVVGQRLLTKRRNYGLMLQGAAIGVLYLDIFGAFSLYDLIPATLAFGLLFAVSALAAVFAVLQNAPALAYAGFAGGFLAPILASSGSGNYVGLFSYYVVLNLALLGIAWFKSWRPLNLLGFYFTFGVAAVWGHDAYSPDKYASTQPFLIAFFIIFASMPILYARRQPLELKGLVDGSLLFGTSVIAFALQLALVEHFTYGAAWSAAGFGAFYVGLAVWLWRHNAEQERLLVEVFLALGVVFVTLVIPFALGAADTAGAWALEGAGLIWVGMRQQRTLARVAGIALQAAAAVFWLDHQPVRDAAMFFNSSYLAGVMLAAAGFFSARLYRQVEGRWEALLEPAFIAWFAAWWFGIGFREIVTFVSPDLMASALVAYGAASAVGITLVCRRWDWTRMQSTALVAVMFLTLALAQRILDVEGALHSDWGWLVWPGGFALVYWVLFKLEPHGSKVLLGMGHVWASLLLVAALQWQVLWLGHEVFDLHETWLFASTGAVHIAVLQLLHRAGFWPVISWYKVYYAAVGGVVAAALGLMIFAGFFFTGEAPPLPWVPVLNPLDVIALIGVLCTATLWLDLNKAFAVAGHSASTRVAWVCLGLAAFVWLNVTLFRILHHFSGIAYDLDAMLASSVAQTSITLLWVSIGMVAVIVASRRGMRNFWLVGGALLAVVVVKLFIEDLANTGSLARIVSFLGVGVVLILIGYFSPLPPKKAVAE